MHTDTHFVISIFKGRQR